MRGEDSKSRQRTAEEREASRRERAERRRQREAREGGSPVAGSPGATSQGGDSPGAGWTGAESQGADSPGTKSQEVAAPRADSPRTASPAAGPPAADPPAVTSEPPIANEPRTPEPHASTDEDRLSDEPPGQQPESWLADDPTGDFDADAPAGARDRTRRPLLRFPHNAGRSAADAEDLWTPALAGTPRATSGAGGGGRGTHRRAAGAHDADGGRPRHRIWPRIVAVLGLLAIAVIAWLLVSVFQPFSGAGHGRVTVRIPKGASASEVGSILAKDGVIESSFFFDIRTFLGGDRGDLHAGTYTLKRGMSYGAAIAALGKANAARPAVVKVVIPEGETRVQIAETAKRDGLKGSYLKASEHAPNFPPSHYGAPAGTPNLEGFLFPATYELDKGAPASDLVQEQLVAFTERFSETAASRAKAMKLTSYQLLIVASMIEREAELPHDRPLVAAVIYNRLRLGMPLGIDATIRFALNDYDKPLTEAQLHIDSPYNTRTHKGLPPTPISNPGTETIEAAAHPAHVKYLYYVAGADGCGDLVFSNTYSEFERDSAEYNEALAKNGGHVPACKHK